MKIRLICFILCIGYAFGFIESQTPTPPPTQPEMSLDLQMMLRTLAKDMEQVQREFTAADMKVKTERPGYHLSAQTLQAEKDAPPAAKPAPEVKK